MERRNRELPILFNTDMVRAILDGRKTATRRLIKPRGLNACGYCVIHQKSDEKIIGVYDYYADGSLFKKPQTPPAQRGDYLYVRETWCNANKPGCEPEYYYFADTNICEDYDSVEWKWCPSIHMPKAAARIWLKVTDVKIQRLQSMTMADFWNEGVRLRPEAYNDPDNAYWQAREQFADVWDATIKKTDLDLYCFDADPMVWVIEFERFDKLLADELEA